MLSESEFTGWCNHLHLPQQTQQLIQQIRSSDPSRRVGGGRKNVAGRYPSQKMGCTIQFESHKVELPHIYELEHDDDVLEYYDQPPSIKLDYQGKNGRNLGVVHTPDYFVIRQKRVGWEECKTEEELKKISQKSPNRYICVEGQWRSPPGENYAKPWGLYYQLWSDSDINWTLQGNFVFLEDYYRADSLNISESTTNTVIKLVTAKPGISLQELLTYSDLKVCYCLKVSVWDFVHHNFDCSMTLSVPPKLKSPVRSSSQPIVTSHLEASLQAILETNNEPPLSMEEVARQLDCDRRTIFRHCPELCRSISARYTDYQKRAYLKKLNDCCAEVKQAVIDLHVQGEYPSEARVSRLITHPGFFRYKRVRYTLREARQLLGFEP